LERAVQLLIGSSSPKSIHALVASTASEAPWLTGIALVPEAPGEIVLSTDADLLGSATVLLQSLSLAEVPGAATDLLGVPSSPVGERRPIQEDIAISAREVAGPLHVDLVLPRSAARDEVGAPATWQEVPAGGHVLLVDTHIMGRAEMPIPRLRFRYVG
jgi:hypothetical protein